jgi:flagellar motility protein MotE (MotC chaperone)
MGGLIRAMAMILACVSVAVVLTEAAAVFVVWQRGWLTPHYLREIRMVFETTEEEKEAAARAEETPKVSLDEVVRERALRILDLDKREKDLQQLHDDVMAQAQEISAARTTITAARDAFRKELEALRKESATAAIEQARGVLLAMPPADAATKLTQISEREAIHLVRGMPEKSIAKILKEFSTTPEQIDRGKKLFEAIARAEPEVAVIDKAENTQPPPARTPAPTP